MNNIYFSRILVVFQSINSIKIWFITEVFKQYDLIINTSMNIS